MKELKLEVGKRYVTREGNISSPVELSEEGEYPFLATEGASTFKASYAVNGLSELGTKRPWDLVEEYKEKQENMRTLKPKDAQRIIGVACNSWKPKLADKWSRNIVMNEDISVTEDDYKEMRAACTKEQNELFDEIFGKDVEYKEGWYRYMGSEKYLAHRGGYKFYGFDINGRWFDAEQETDSISELIKAGYTPATNEEVEAALIKEAERRGLHKEGVEYNSPIQGEWVSSGNYNPFLVGDGGFFYDANGGCTFYKGKWAEIISEPKTSPTPIKEVTLKEISEWKGVSVENIRIKE